MRAFLVSISVMLALGAAAWAGEPGAPLQSVTVRLDPASGHVDIETRIDAPEGPVRLPDLGWLRLESLTLDGKPLAADGAIPASRHQGRTVTARLSGTIPGISPGLEPWGRAAESGYLAGDGWLPRDAERFGRFEVRVDLPAGYRALATGSLTEETVAEGRYAARFVLTGRPEDLGLFFGRYEIGEEIRDGVRLRTYFRPEDTALSGAYLEAAGGYLAPYADRIGPYPYGGFSVVSAPIPVGLGFAGLTYVSQSILAHPYMRGRSLAHEILHSWWGNAVGVDYESGNWCEGLTTFQADYALAEAEGPDAAREMRRDWLRALAALAPEENTSLREFRAASHTGVQAVGYGKSALVFHMLRGEIGPAAFDHAIRAFYAAERSKIAAWGDLRAAFEAESGRDLAWFFAQWIGRAGLPRITLDAAEPVVRDGRPALRVTLRQSAPAYRLFVPLRIETDAGPVERVLEMSETVATAIVDLEAAPDELRVDPGFDLARELLPGEVAPTLGDLFGNRAARVAVAGGDGALAEAARGLARRLLRTDGLNLVPPDALEDAPAALIVGSTRDVAAARDGLIDAAAPWDMATGTARAWAERDAKGRLRIFVSADTAGLLASELGGLGYQASRSYAAYATGDEVATGTWEPTGSPLRMTFE